MRIGKPQWPWSYSKASRLEAGSRLTEQPAYVLKEWQESFLQGGQATFHAGGSAKEKTLEGENRSLQAKEGSLVMDNDLLYAKIDRLEDGGPLHLRKSKC